MTATERTGWLCPQCGFAHAPSILTCTNATRVQQPQPIPRWNDDSFGIGTFDRIVAKTCEWCRLTPQIIASRRRQREIVEARQIICYLAREMTSLSFPAMARRLGGFDHTSILHHANRGKVRFATEPEFANNVLIIKARVEGRPESAQSVPVVDRPLSATLRAALEEAAAVKERRAISAARYAEITAKYTAGASAEEVAREYGVTRERICQILRKSNAIEHKWGRKRLAQEELAHETETIKSEAKRIRAEKLTKAVELVRSGLSLSEAARQADMVNAERTILSGACREAGIPIMHGRWRDFEARRQRVGDMLAQGTPKSRIIETLRKDGEAVNIQWINNNFPQSVVGHRGPALKRPLPLRPRGLRKQPLDSIWADERTADLIRHWLNGVTAQQISDLFGGEPFTRNAVIGKIGRLRAAGALVRPAVTNGSAVHETITNDDLLQIAKDQPIGDNIQ